MRERICRAPRATQHPFQKRQCVVRPPYRPIRRSCLHQDPEAVTTPTHAAVARGLCATSTPLRRRWPRSARVYVHTAAVHHTRLRLSNREQLTRAPRHCLAVRTLQARPSRVGAPPAGTPGGARLFAHPTLVWGPDASNLLRRGVVVARTQGRTPVRPRRANSAQARQRIFTTWATRERAEKPPGAPPPSPTQLSLPLQRVVPC